MPLRNALCALAALFAMAGCSQEELLKKIASPEDEKTATECLERLRVGDIANLEARMDPTLQAPNLHATLEQIAQILPDEKPASVKLVGAQSNKSIGERSINVTYQYGYGDGRWFLVNCATKRAGDTETIIGISVNTLEKPIEEQGKFELAGKSPLHYAVLFLGILFVVLTLVALIRCITEKDLKRKWLWIIFIIFGVCQFSLDWNTGQWTFTPLYFLLFSAGASWPGFGVMQVSIALPLGAIVYLARRMLNHRHADRSNPV
jgi:hypothetical protein